MFKKGDQVLTYWQVILFMIFHMINSRIFICNLYLWLTYQALEGVISGILRIWSLISMYYDNIYVIIICTGSGFKSMRPFRSGYFGTSIKLQPGYTAGVITAFYVSLFMYSFYARANFFPFSMIEYVLEKLTWKTSQCTCCKHKYLVWYYM